MNKQRVRTQLSVEVPPELLERLKATAAQTNRTLTSIVVDFLQASLDETSCLTQDAVLAERVVTLERSLRMLTKDAVSQTLGIDLESTTMSETMEAAAFAWLDAQNKIVDSAPRNSADSSCKESLIQTARKCLCNSDFEIVKAIEDHWTETDGDMIDAGLVASRLNRNQESLIKKCKKLMESGWLCMSKKPFQTADGTEGGRRYYLWPEQDHRAWAHHVQAAREAKRVPA